MTPAKVERPLSDLKASKKTEIIANLNTALATNIDLYLIAKQAHWNVKGPHFHGLHELFDSVSDSAREYADELAERAVALGGVARGTLADVGSSTKLPKFAAGEHKWQVLVKEVHDRVLAASEQARTFADGLEDDMATQDLYIEIIRGLDKWAWMVEAHLG